MKYQIGDLVEFRLDGYTEFDKQGIILDITESEFTCDHTEKTIYIVFDIVSFHEARKYERNLKLMCSLSSVAEQ
jgi:hypothetical protein